MRIGTVAKNALVGAVVKLNRMLRPFRARIASSAVWANSDSSHPVPIEYEATLHVEGTIPTMNGWAIVARRLPSGNVFISPLYGVYSVNQPHDATRHMVDRCEYMIIAHDSWGLFSVSNHEELCLRVEMTSSEVMQHPQWIVFKELTLALYNPLRHPEVPEETPETPAAVETPAAAPDMLVFDATGRRILQVAPNKMRIVLNENAFTLRVGEKIKDQEISSVENVGYETVNGSPCRAIVVTLKPYANTSSN